MLAKPFTHGMSQWKTFITEDFSLPRLNMVRIYPSKSYDLSHGLSSTITKSIHIITIPLSFIPWIIQSNKHTLVFSIRSLLLDRITMMISHDLIILWLFIPPKIVCVLDSISMSPGRHRRWEYGNQLNMTFFQVGGMITIPLLNTVHTFIYVYPVVN